MNCPRALKEKEKAANAEELKAKREREELEVLLAGPYACEDYIS